MQGDTGGGGGQGHGCIEVREREQMGGDVKVPRNEGQTRGWKRTYSQASGK